MCGGAIADFFDFTARSIDKIDFTNITDPLTDALRTRSRDGERRRRRPSLDVNEEYSAAAAAQQKKLLAATFGVSDTKVTGGQGLGSVPPSLLMPKPTLGG